MERRRLQSKVSAPRRLASDLAIFALLVALVGAAPFLAAPAARAQPTDSVTAALVPATAPLFVAVSPDPDAPALARVVDLARGVGLGDALDELTTGLMTTWPFLASALEDGRFAGSETALAVVDPAVAFGQVEDREGGFVILLHLPNGAEALHADALAALRSAAGDADTALQSATYNGVVVAALPGDAALARVGATLLVAARAEDLLPAIDAATGDLPALASDDDFIALRAALPLDPLAFAYADGFALRGPIAAGLGEGTATQVGIFSATRVLDRTLALALRADEVGLRLDLVMGPVAGASSPVAAPPTLTLDRLVGDDTVLFFDGVDLGASYLMELAVLSLSQAIVADQSGDDESIFLTLTDPARIYEAVAGLIAFNPRTGFADLLTGEYALAVSAVSLDLGGVDAVVVSGAEEPLLLSDALAKLTALVNAALQDGSPSGRPRAETRLVGGGVVQSLVIPIEGFGAVRLEYGVVGGRFVLGYRSGLRNLVAGPVAPLTRNPRYQAMLAELPAEHDWRLFVDVAALAPLLGPFLVQVDLPSDIVDLSGLESLGAVGSTRDGLRVVSLVLVAPRATDPSATPVATPMVET